MIVLTSLTACINDKFDVCPDEEGDNWITLQFILPGEASATRGNPSGGEDGDGREKGISGENKLHDLNLFLFAGVNGFLNAAGETELTHLYFNLDDPQDEDNTISFEKEGPADEDLPGDKVYVIKFKSTSQINSLVKNDTQIKFITVANVNGKMVKPAGGGGDADGNFNLSDLLEYEKNLQKTWEGTAQDVKNYDYFVMTTAYGDPYSKIEFNGTSGDGSVTKPFYGESTLQRMCSRIDVMYKDAEEENGRIAYKVIKDNNELQGRFVHLIQVLPVNVMSKPSYLFKKVTKTTDWTQIADFTWGGRETVDADGRPSNIVIEPTTSLKGGSIQDLTGWYGVTRSSVIVGNGDNSLKSGKGDLSGYHNVDISSILHYGNGNAKIITYANENTQQVRHYTSDYLTGLALRAIYQPDRVYKKADLTATDAVAEFADLTDGKIWRYVPIDSKYEDETVSLYFSNAAAVNEYRDNHPGENGVITEFPEVVEVTDGESSYFGFYTYYNLWLRHYLDNINTEHLPMEYAIVRNNIYRVSFTFSGPGDPTPTLREPDTMNARIYVIKWNFRPQPPIQM